MTNIQQINNRELFHGFVASPIRRQRSPA
jgi:hypothetical protein